MTTELMERDELRFLHGDLRAAAWVRDANETVDDATLLGKFFAIHQFFLKNIGRERNDIFTGITEALVADVVRKWIVLYRRTLAALQARFPRQPGTPDLRLAGVNWSFELGTSYEGLLMGTSYASRFAEFWAEKSLRDPATYASYDARLGFVDTPPYWRVHELGKARVLVVVDELVNSITPFDLIPASAGATGADELRARFRARGWRVDALTDEAAATLIELGNELSTRSLP